MGWARFDDEYPRHAKLQAIPAGVRADAMALELAALCYSTRLLTDGHIPASVTHSLALEVGFERRNRVDSRRLQSAIRALIEVGRWHENGGPGYMIHDFPDYQPTAVEVKERRRKETEKKRKQRAQERLSLDLSPPSSPGDKGESSPRDSTGDASHVRATGARAPARPAPSPEGADLRLSPSGEKVSRTTPAAAQPKGARPEDRSEDAESGQLAVRVVCPICGPLRSVPNSFDLDDHLRNVHDVDPASYHGEEAA